MKDVKVVIGANFGDEGKGLITDYLVHQFEKVNKERTLVVRFNGGAQAGHTVKVGNISHVFHHVGSGTLRGAATYLTSDFVCSPMLFVKEIEDLWLKGVTHPLVYVSPFAQVTTPYDIMINQRLEQLRGENRHGSCGVGFNETLQRSKIGVGHINHTIPLQVHTLGEPEVLRSILGLIREWYVPERLEQLGIHLDEELLMSDIILENFIEDCRLFHKSTVLASNKEELFSKYNNVVFEGAQGLRLDQDYGDFPYVTHSKTGLFNVFATLSGHPYQTMEVYYVTRGYLTRHGAGPLENEYNERPYETIVDETNIHNDYQGSLRFAPLNVDKMASYIIRDIVKFSQKKFDIAIAVTCLDQIPDDEEIRVVGEIEKYADGGRLLVSYGPEAKNVGEIVNAKLEEIK